MQSEPFTWNWSDSEASGRPLDESRAPELQRLLERCSDFMQLVNGVPVQANGALELLRGTPPGVQANDHLVLGVYSPGDELMGVLTALRGYPSPDVWWIGELLFVPERRGGGLGRSVYRRFEAWALHRRAGSIRLVVQKQNPRALRFWRQLGFVELGSAQQHLPNRVNEVLVMERKLVP